MIASLFSLLFLTNSDNLEIVITVSHKVADKEYFSGRLVYINLRRGN